MSGGAWSAPPEDPGADPRTGGLVEAAFVPTEKDDAIKGTPCDTTNDYDENDPWFEQDLEEDAALIAQHSDRAKELGFENNDKFAEYLQDRMHPRTSADSTAEVIKKPGLKNGRIAWYDKEQGIIIIRNANNPVKSTAYKGTLDEFLRLS